MFLGGLHIGIDSKGERLRHWFETIKNPDIRHDRWHYLCEDFIPWSCQVRELKKRKKEKKKKKTDTHLDEMLHQQMRSTGDTGDDIFHSFEVMVCSFAAFSERLWYWLLSRHSFFFFSIIRRFINNAFVLVSVFWKLENNATQLGKVMNCWRYSVLHKEITYSLLFVAICWFGFWTINACWNFLAVEFILPC